MPCHLAPAYQAALVQARITARGYGYAIALHGSGMRDLDLIAAPWADGAASAERLAQAVASAVRGFIEPTRNPVRKPHGRLAWTIHLGGGPFIDLSVMPRRRTRGKAAA